MNIIEEVLEEGFLNMLGLILMSTAWIISDINNQLLSRCFFLNRLNKSEVKLPNFRFT